MSLFTCIKLILLCCICVIATVPKDIATWTWISGNDVPFTPGVYGQKGQASSDNVPGARRSSVGWYDEDAQELWVFGGFGCDSNGTVGAWICCFGNMIMSINVLLGLLNDLWRYKMNEGLWTWISGSETVNQLGVYGEKGISKSDNIPGARGGSVGWLVINSENKEFWIFGGDGFDTMNLDFR